MKVLSLACAWIASIASKVQAIDLPIRVMEMKFALEKTLAKEIKELSADELLI